MNGQPKLKLKMPNGYEEVRELEDARKLMSDWGTMVLLEGKVINSHDELVKIARDNYQGKEFIEVQVIPFIEGG